MKTLIMSVVVLTVATVVFKAEAGTWECGLNPGNPHGNPQCYVTDVRMRFDNGSYLIDIEIDNKSHDKTTFDYVRLQINYNGATEDRIRAIEALALTAMTTGLPVQFYCYGVYNGTEYKYCYPNQFAVGKP